MGKYERAKTQALNSAIIGVSILVRLRGWVGVDMEASMQRIRPVSTLFDSHSSSILLLQVRQPTPRTNNRKHGQTGAVKLKGKFFTSSKKARSEYRSPARRDIAVEIVAAVQPIVSSGVGVHERGQGAQVWTAQNDLPAGIDEPQGYVVDVRVCLP